MKEILVLTVCLGIVLIVPWVVVVVLERRKERKAQARRAGKGIEEEKDGRPEVGSDGIAAAIVAGILAYQGEVGQERITRERIIYEKKEEKVSLWRVKERMKQII